MLGKDPSRKNREKRDSFKKESETLNRYWEWKFSKKNLVWSFALKTYKILRRYRDWNTSHKNLYANVPKERTLHQ